MTRATLHRALGGHVVRHWLPPVLAAVGLMLAAACGPSATSTPTPGPTATPTRPPAAPTATATPTRPPAATTPTTGTQAPTPTATSRPVVVATVTPTSVPTPTPTAAQRGPAQWIIARSDDPAVKAHGNVEPTTATAGAAQVETHMADRLIEIDGPGVTLVPGLAERWEFRDDGKTLRVFLRKGVKFHDGSTFDAQDVAYTHATEQSGKRIPPNRDSLMWTVVVLDDFTVDLKTKDAFPYAPHQLARGGITVMPKPDVGERDWAEFDKHPIGTGPYRSISFEKSVQHTLEHFDGYWGGVARPDRLKFIQVREPGTRVANLLTGEVQIATDIPFSEIDRLQNSTIAEPAPLKNSTNIVYTINATKAPFTDVRVRQAMNYAVDRASIVKSILKGYGTVTTSVLSEGWEGYDPSLKPYPYDPQKAKQLLKDAGLANGFSFEFQTTTGVFQQDLAIAEAIAAQLGEVGIRATVRPLDRTLMGTNLREGKYELVTWAWVVQAATSGVVDQRLNQPGGFKTLPEFQVLEDLLAKASAQIDEGARAKAWAELNQKFQELAPELYVHQQDGIYAAARDIQWKPFPNRGRKGDSWYYDRPAMLRSMNQKGLLPAYAQDLIK